MMMFIVLAFLLPLLCEACSSTGGEVVSLRSYNYPDYSIGLDQSDVPYIRNGEKELFRVVQPGLQGTPGTVSFESVRYPGRYLRHANYLLHLHVQSYDDLYRKDATFWPRNGLFFAGYTAYESFNYPGYFIRHQNYRLKISKDTSLLFKKDSSFLPLPAFPVFRFRSHNYPTYYIGMHGSEPRIVQGQELFRLITPGLTGTPGTVTFESMRFPGKYLRHSNYLLQVHAFDDSNAELFKKDATYYPREDRFFEGFTAYESFNYPNYFIRHENYRLKIATEATYSELFQRDASFKQLHGLPVMGDY